MIIMITKYLKPNTKKALLVEPNFPYPRKRAKDYQPIGLLKISTYLKKQGITTQLMTKDQIIPNYQPDIIFITSIFTYWSQSVQQTTQLLRETYPNTPIIIGGVYASLMPEHCQKTCTPDDIITGIIPETENLKPDYSLLGTDYQVIHSTRGCIRKCTNCGVYKVEPQWTCKKSIKNELVKRKILFYDNNILANTHIEDLLNELIWLKKLGQITTIESQSGFDARILVKKPHLAKMLKQAGFTNIRIAWDGPYKTGKIIKKAIKLLTDAGYTSNKIQIFMLFNYTLPYEELEKKRVKCYEWKVVITDCRYVPLNAPTDNYNPRKRKQTPEEYHIHKGWTDQLIRKFKRNIRKHNICVRYKFQYHTTTLEKNQNKKYDKLTYEEAQKKYPDAWNPAQYHPPDEIEKTKTNFYGKLQERKK